MMLIAIWLIHQNTWSCVSGQESMLHTSVLLIGIAKLPFSIPCISRATGLISTKFKYYLYAPHIHDLTKLKKIGSVVYD